MKQLSIHLKVWAAIAALFAATFCTHAQSVLHNNGGFITHPGRGHEVADASTTETLPAGTVGTLNSQTLATGDTPITWSLESGSLPNGLDLPGNTISGTPTTAGTSNFTVKATNSIGSATSTVDNTKSGTGTVTVTSPLPQGTGELDWSPLHNL